MSSMHSRRCSAMVVGVIALITAAVFAVPQPGSVAIRTFTASGVAVPFTDVRVTQLEGTWPEDTIHSTTNIAGTRWVAVLPGLYEFAALDEDGHVVSSAEVGVASGAEFILYVIVPYACTTDVDDSGDTGFSDLLAIFDAWGYCLECPEDLTGDNSINFADLLGVIGWWGPCAD